MIDSLSVKTTELAESRGIDGNKRIKGHKRHLAYDPIQVIKIPTRMHCPNTIMGAKIVITMEEKRNF